ncbi:hypothetical protein [Tellurirhabdus bombi]|uniref:hypothetical protein n=1 Tax=Tellurirhabdus bombi TaxID=2907205 RepID=UPI001F490802|nr:hypothetical protein [Tellurirhabdus bombi]
MNECTNREEILSPAFLDLIDQQEYLSSDFAYKVIRPSAENLHLLRVQITASSVGWRQYNKLKEMHSRQELNHC